MTEHREKLSDSTAGRSSDNERDDPGARLQGVLRRNRQTGKGGVYAVCSAHPQVIEAAIRQSLEDGSVLHVESTSSQVNQFGGYTGLTPRQFAHQLHTAAQSAGLPSQRVLLGGDHLGPYPWRHEASGPAIEKACALVRACVAAGYQKIHLDASMACADDEKTGPEEGMIARRAATLCRAAEEAYRELPAGSPLIVYVVGTEVPAPGGESLEAQAPAVTSAGHVHRTLEIFEQAFREQGLSSAWERVVALVVQPGVDFGSSAVFHYDRAKARSLSEALARHPGIVYEAHSTDYQTARALSAMVGDHFAILKVGPWLTFAFREAVLALSAVERELLKAKPGARLSHIRQTLEAAMLRDPSQWRAYYHGDEAEVRRDLIYGYSDRCRYYWHGPAVQEEITRLFDNLAGLPIPFTLVSQFLPAEYEAIRWGRIEALPAQMIHEHIRRVLRIYSAACAEGRKSAGSPAACGQTE